MNVIEDTLRGLVIKNALTTPYVMPVPGAGLDIPNLEPNAIDPASVTRDTDLRRELGIRSLDRLWIELEETFSIVLTDVQLGAVSTFGDLLDAVNGADHAPDPL